MAASVRWWIASAETIASHGPSGSSSSHVAVEVRGAVAEPVAGAVEHPLRAVEQHELGVGVAVGHLDRQRAGAGAEVEHALGRAAEQRERVDRRAVEAVVLRDQPAPVLVVGLGLRVEELAGVVHAAQGGTVDSPPGAVLG